MNVDICARCEKTVYQIEGLKCLDKMWHKRCFKCQECGMVLNLKTYKGYNKLPYCNAHAPQVKHTAVADTPEARRLKENTRIQSNIMYHQDFEKLKGKFTQVADDPETLRICNTSKIISNLTYHGELEKKKQMEEKRNLLQDGDNLEPTQNLNINQAINVGNSSQWQQPINESPNRMNRQVNYDNNAPINMAPPQSNNPKQSTVIYTSEYGPVTDFQNRKIGSIANYNPMNEGYPTAVATDYREPMYTIVTPNMPQPIQSREPPSKNCFRSMYNYHAQEDDEVSLIEGDVIIDCQFIADGWMSGTVQRTGQRGMLPANYIEPYMMGHSK